MWFVFRDERFDYRLLALGALLPDLVDVFAGGAWVMHSVTASVAALVLVMVATRGRRPSRRKLLAVPIGMFMHLVFDGAFARTKVFWWPFAGLSHAGARLPTADRGVWNIPLELAGAAALVWMARRHGLRSAARRSEFVRTGELHDTAGAAGGVGTC